MESMPNGVRPVKEFTYNYALKCPVYYSPLMSQTFTRNDCPPGYYGSDVIYTVPANTYQSTVSPEYVIYLAQNDINTNGQAYANANGSCSSTPPTVIYARVEADYSSYYYDGCVYTYYYDVYIRFYSDPNGTIPLSVTNLDVNYADIYGNPFTVYGCSGTQVYLGNYGLEYGDCYPQGGPFYYGFYTTSGTGYTPI
jgi:hypothetical protein